MDRALRLVPNSVFSKGRAREFNLGMIDFANKVCTVRKPKCNECVIKDICDYYFNRVTKASLVVSEQSL